MSINNKHLNTERQYKTTSFYVAAFLCTNDFILVDIEKTNDKRSTFVLHDEPRRVALLESFNFARPDAPEVMVDARKFITAIRQLKEKLYQEKL
jgi:hypothetical protein